VQMYYIVLYCKQLTKFSSVVICQCMTVYHLHNEVKPHKHPLNAAEKNIYTIEALWINVCWLVGSSLPLASQSASCDSVTLLLRQILSAHQEPVMWSNLIMWPWLWWPTYISVSITRRAVFIPWW